MLQFTHLVQKKKYVCGYMWREGKTEREERERENKCSKYDHWGIWVK